MQSKLVALLIIVLSFWGCTSKNSDENSSVKIKAAVSILPMKFIAEQIGGDKIDISVIIPNGSDPHTFDPSSKTIKKVHDSDVYFKIGGTFVFEKNIISDLQSNDISKFVDCSKGISLIENDPHIWLGMDESKIIASNIASKLIRIDSKNEQFYKSNLNIFNQKVDSLKSVVHERLSDLSNRKILVYHPAWRYFLSQFNLIEESVEKDGKHPKAGDLRQIINQSNEQNINAIFIEEQFNPDAAKSIAHELNIPIIKVNPLTENLFFEWNNFSVKIKERAN